MIIDVTPVLLTLDEAANLERVLARLAWAREVVIVDSGSRDATLDIAARAGNVRVVERRFDNHAAQWNFALHETGIESEWVLTLDSDYVLDCALVAELAALDPPATVDAYRARFTYWVNGRALRGSLYPPRAVLARRRRARYVQHGHTQHLVFPGACADLAGLIHHDDRKPMDRWLRSQWRYARLEAAFIEASAWRDLSWSGRLRALLVPALPAALAWSLLFRGGVLDGLPGLYYAVQRAVAEGLITIALLERRFGAGDDPDSPAAVPGRAPPRG